MLELMAGSPEFQRWTNSHLEVVQENFWDEIGSNQGEALLEKNSQASKKV
jgi:hypothetical protein